MTTVTVHTKVAQPPKTFVIAEVGSTHDGHLQRMYRMIKQAKEIGADAVKFQWTSNPARLAHRRRLPPGAAKAYKKIAFQESFLSLLKTTADVVGIEFMCTVYLPEDIHVIAPFVERFKIASFEALDLHFRRLHDEFGKPIITSLGMMSAQEIRDLESGTAYGRRGNAWLHCISKYPTPADEINLAGLRLMSEYSNKIGLSDHTVHPWTGALAVAAGAKVVEFHFRDQQCPRNNNDYPHSRNYNDATDYISNIRFAEDVIGVERPQETGYAPDQGMRAFRVETRP